MAQTPKTPKVFSELCQNVIHNIFEVHLSTRQNTKVLSFFVVGVLLAWLCILTRACIFRCRHSRSLCILSHLFVNKTWQAQFSQSWPTLLIEAQSLFQNRSQQSVRKRQVGRHGKRIQMGLYLSWLHESSGTLKYGQLTNWFPTWCNEFDLELNT